MDTPLLHIEIDEKGIPRTINRRVKVKMIAENYQAGTSAEVIAEHYGIMLADVYAALAYYHDNQADFERHDQDLQPLIDDAQRYSDELKAKMLQRMQRQTNE